jgi:hypothetical protein
MVTHLITNPTGFPSHRKGSLSLMRYRWVEAPPAAYQRFGPGFQIVTICLCNRLKVDSTTIVSQMVSMASEVHWAIHSSQLCGRKNGGGRLPIIQKPIWRWKSAYKGALVEYMRFGEVAFSVGFLMTFICFQLIFSWAVAFQHKYDVFMWGGMKVWFMEALGDGFTWSPYPWDSTYTDTQLGA